jgi:hypothetical protein
MATITISETYLQGNVDGPFDHEGYVAALTEAYRAAALRCHPDASVSVEIRRSRACGAQRRPDVIVTDAGGEWLASDAVELAMATERDELWNARGQEFFLTDVE